MDAVFLSLFELVEAPHRVYTAKEVNQWRNNGVGRVGKVQGPTSAGAAEFQAKNNLTDLQILGCELHKNAFGGRAPPSPLAVIRGREGRERKGLGIAGGRGWKKRT